MKLTADRVRVAAADPPTVEVPPDVQAAFRFQSAVARPGVPIPPGRYAIVRDVGDTVVLADPGTDPEDPRGVFWYVRKRLLDKRGPGPRGEAAPREDAPDAD